ncbi:hypothetical protein Golomagni_01647, partial [Golovinomyces magnicellulatus]
VQKALLVRTADVFFVTKPNENGSGTPNIVPTMTTIFPARTYSTLGTLSKGYLARLATSATSRESLAFMYEILGQFGVRLWETSVCRRRENIHVRSEMGICTTLIGVRVSLNPFALT